jgi:hypothetical protein
MSVILWPYFFSLQTGILFFVVQKLIYSFNWKSVFNVNYFKQI